MMLVYDSGTGTVRVSLGSNGEPLFESQNESGQWEQFGTTDDHVYHLEMCKEALMVVLHAKLPDDYILKRH